MFEINDKLLRMFQKERCVIFYHQTQNVRNKERRWMKKEPKSRKSQAKEMEEIKKA